MHERIALFLGDITTMQVDAIVNAAKRSLLGGGGVDGAIHRAGGPAILAECRVISERQGGCPTGEAVITTAGNLPAKYVIHTVGPVWRGGEAAEAILLSNCYSNSLRLAVENDLRTIAFPNISTGVFGYPKIPACDIALNSVRQFLSENNTVEQVIFVCFDRENYQLYEAALTENG